MEQIEFPQDFSEFLKLLNAELFDDPNRIVRMGEAPLRIEILTEIDGVNFTECSKRAITQTVAGETIPVISLSDLKANKRASGRAKDLDDLENLP